LANPSKGVGNVNKTGIYAEDGWVAKVEILEDNSSADWLRYKLKVINTRQAPRFCHTPEIGTIFSVDKKINAGFYGIWDLQIDG
jgi:hypothetical protein